MLMSIHQLAGNIANLPTSSLNTFSLQYLSIRFAYMVAYINTPADQITLSYIRSTLWAIGGGLCVQMLVRAGQALS